MVAIPGDHNCESGSVRRPTAGNDLIEDRPCSRKITSGAVESEDGCIGNNIGDDPQTGHIIEQLEGATDITELAEGLEKDVAGTDVGDDSELSAAVAKEVSDKVRTVVLDHGIEESVEGADGGLEAAEGGDGEKGAKGRSRTAGEGVSTDEEDEGVLGRPQSGTEERGEYRRKEVESAGAGEAEDDVVVRRVGRGETRDEAVGVVEDAEGEIRVGGRADEGGESAACERGGPIADGRSHGVGLEKVGSRPEGGEVIQIHRRREVRQVNYRREAPPSQIDGAGEIETAIHSASWGRCFLRRVQNRLTNIRAILTAIN